MCAVFSLHIHVYCKQLYICTMCNLNVLCILNNSILALCTLNILCILYICTVHSKFSCVYSIQLYMCTIYVLCILYICTMYTLNVLCILYINLYAHSKCFWVYSIKKKNNCFPMLNVLVK